MLNKTEVFKKLADKDKLSHAYLFFGEAKTEKFDFAVSLVNYIEKGNFKKPKESEILEETLIIAPAESGSIGIDEVRSLSHFLYQMPVFSKKRIAIINNAHNLTTEAQNSILKIIEDSPEYALIILISKSEDLLVPPLVSRLQKVYFADAQIAEKESEKNTYFDFDDIIENNRIDEFFENLINQLRNDPIKNSGKLSEVLKRLTLIKMFNTNKKLQLKSLWDLT